MISLYCNDCKQDHRNELAQWCDRSDLEIENEKLKRVLEIAKKSLLVSCHILNEEEADIAMEKSQKALEEINEVLGDKVRP